VEFNSLIRDASKIHDALEEIELDGSVVAKREVKIYIPTRFADKDLAYIGVQTYIVGIYAITVDDMFFLMNLVIVDGPHTRNNVIIQGII